MDEDDFEADQHEDGGAEGTASNAAGAMDDLPGSDSAGGPLPELPDPAGLRGGVVLRPYQRQALYWMHRRERVSELGGEIDGACDELSLLSELAGASASVHPSQSSSDSSTVVLGGKPISCDCGPVTVNDAQVASTAVPVADYWDDLTSNEPVVERKKNYAHHPLWQRRFLSTDDLRSVYAFYINEMLGIASAMPPNPPKQCVGGILADAMGLGKTVMLMSLILKSKEYETGILPDDNDVEENTKAIKLPTADSSLKDGKGVSSPKSVPRSLEKEIHIVVTGKGGPTAADVEVLDLSSDTDVDGSDGDDEDYVEPSGECSAPSKARRTEKPEIKSFKESSNATSTPLTFSTRNSHAAKSAGTTLVITPLSLVSQWEEELATKTNLSHHVHYDNASKKQASGGSSLFESVDVVVTTYGTVQGEFLSLSRKKSKPASASTGMSSPLLSFHWKRVILDEAHGIKNPATAVSKACCMLNAESRWCVTGTPIQNSLQDVYGLLKFLRHEPWCEAAFWRIAITNTFGYSSGEDDDKAGGGGKDVSNSLPTEKAFANAEKMTVILGRVRRVLSPLILRRTKNTLTEDGKSILSLPPIQFATVSVTFSPPEKEFYSALLTKSQSVFDGFIKAGNASKSWFAIFSLLQRLRQACDHVSLTVKTRLDAMDFQEESKMDCEVDENIHDSVNDKFLKGLLEMFQSSTSKSSTVVDEEPHNEESTQFARQVAESLTQTVQSNDDYLQSECPICLEEPKLCDVVHTPCAHMFCRTCLLGTFQEQQKRRKNPVGQSSAHENMKGRHKDGGQCPVCHEPVDISKLIEITKSKSTGEVTTKYLQAPTKEETTGDMDESDVAARETLASALRGAHSSKLEAVLNELEEVWKMDPGSKVLIFSQFLGFLDIAGVALQKRGITSFRLDGKMSLKQRIVMIERFTKEKSVKEDVTNHRGSVFLVSMKAGGVGLNLVAASSVFIIDPWWNSAVEDQCINRIHRIGQQAQIVRVRTFVVAESVEEKIIALQQKKKGMANEILSDDDGGSQLSDSKPTLDDLKLLFGR